MTLPLCHLKLLLHTCNGKKNERVEKVNIFGTVSDVFTELKKQLKHYLIYTYIKRKQMAKMDELIEACNVENVVLQVDFSENASIVSQREVQSAHWSHGQATLSLLVMHGSEVIQQLRKQKVL